ncbi:uncharacterized protein AMSG_02903 [Thecamonas trahens ATCC 50062]|uniref:Uncharacterized protein n=1 Tax=Thecamonas trahens ATCC 50062 TaxID=461836 RepID=A0A0L0D2M1_THETB|nr:hypothetical protein AMSG_02903 [Thecamonas trahens ATCC 50062]KNC46446.1 hypothetical protein AMSG_02903 [Thecamonas trahens ATCC 50062]|eukprot:XP_013760737.1 hypothetical protein AMSG_02903 [Thecamonas trahens ATCC 50062]
MSGIRMYVSRGRIGAAVALWSRQAMREGLTPAAARNTRHVKKWRKRQDDLKETRRRIHFKPIKKRIAEIMEMKRQGM